MDNSVPGLRNEQVAEKIATKFLEYAKKQEFLDNSIEGYISRILFIYVDYTGKEFAKNDHNFNEHFSPQCKKTFCPKRRTDTMLKVASLIERESGGDEDKL